MNLGQLTELFQWMTIINVCFYVLSSILLMMLKGVVCRVHGKLFGIEEDKVATISYGYLGMYKVLVIVFNPPKADKGLIPRRLRRYIAFEDTSLLAAG